MTDRPSRDERRRRFARYEDAVKRTGKPFLPGALIHDALMGLLVVALLVLTVVIWYSQGRCGHAFDLQCHKVLTPIQQQRTHPPLGPLYDSPVDPAATHYDPKPDWYFLFLFELFRVFRNVPALAIIPTIGIPLIGLVVLLAIPFVDRGPERRILRRPLAVGTVVVVGVALLVLSWMGENVNSLKGSQHGTGLAAAVTALPGWTIVQDGRCLDCHVIGNQGEQQVKAPSLTNESERGRGVYWQIQHLDDPASRTAASLMPRLGGSDLTPLQVQLVSEFLESLDDPAEAHHYATAGVSAKYMGHPPLTTRQRSGFYTQDGPQ